MRGPKEPITFAEKIIKIFWPNLGPSSKAMIFGAGAKEKEKKTKKDRKRKRERGRERAYGEGRKIGWRQPVTPTKGGLAPDW